MTRNWILDVAVIVVVAAAAVVVWQSPTAQPSSASASRVAGAYIDNLAAQNGVHIVGDKVWRVIRNGKDEVTVVIRVKFEQTSTFLGPSATRLPPQWATVYVKEIRSGYQVISSA